MTRHYERRLQRLIHRLPNRLQLTICWLRRPSSRWARISAGLLLTMLNTFGVSAGVRLVLTGLVIVGVSAAAGGQKTLR